MNRCTTKKVRFIQDDKWIGEKYSEWSIRWVPRHYFIDMSTRYVKDVSYYVWIRGVAWPRVSHEIQSVEHAKYYWLQRVLSAIINNQ